MGLKHSVLPARISAEWADSIDCGGVFEGALAGIDLERLVDSDFDLDAVGYAAFSRLLARLRTGPDPVVVVATGTFLGGGLGLIGVADVVLSQREARFGLPEVQVGLLPSLVWPHVERRIGLARARLLALGPSIDAETACAWGLVDSVHDDCSAERDRWVRRLERAEPRALARVRRFGEPGQATRDALEEQLALTDVRRRIQDWT